MKTPAPLGTLAVTGAAAFVASLDQLVVVTALPAIRLDLGAHLAQLGWTVSAYTLAFAVTLLPASALGDRVGRRRMLSVGLGLFGISSAAAAVAPSIWALVVARAGQGVAGAIMLPLAISLLAAAAPPDRRGAALGLLSGVTALGVALGPVVGGTLTQAFGWQWIFWLNVPITALAAVAAPRTLPESRLAHGRIDGFGLVLAGSGMLLLVSALLESGSAGTFGLLPRPAAIAAGAAILSGFVAWESRVRHPLLPLTLFRDRWFAVVQAATALMYLGMLGAVFLLAQFLQIAQGYSPLQAGIRTLPWTATMMLVAPIAGSLSDRLPRRTILATGLGLQTAALAAIAALGRPTTPYAVIAIAYAVAGLGMALYQAPALGAILVTLPSAQHARATGAMTTIREASSVLGVAVLASLFSRYGGYESAEAFADGLRPALVAASIALAAAAVVVRFVLPRRTAGGE